MPPPPNQGWLARALVQADFHLRDVESQVEGYLSWILPVALGGWKGWSFLQGDGGHVEINVYQVTTDPIVRGRVVDSLHRVGFTTVILHQHRAARFLTCVCAASDRV